MEVQCHCVLKCTVLVYYSFLSYVLKYIGLVYSIYRHDACWRIGEM